MCGVCNLNEAQVTKIQKGMNSNEFELDLLTLVTRIGIMPKLREFKDNTELLHNLN